MSPLTKAFVVLATILAVVMVTLTVAIVARVDDYRAAYGDVVASRDAAINSEKAMRVELQNDLNQKSALAQGFQADIARLTKERDDANLDDEEMATRLAEQSQNIAKLVAANEAAAANVSALSDRVARQDEMIRTLTSDLADAGGQLSAVTQSLQTTAASLRRTENELNRVQEQNVDLEQRLQEKTALIDSLKEQGVELVIAPPSVNGQVTGVDQVTEGLTLVQVNVGARDGVKKDMEFTVYRGDEFVATIKMQTVDTAEAVGQITLGGGIKSGDRVQSGR